MKAYENEKFSLRKQAIEIIKDFQEARKENNAPFELYKEEKDDVEKDKEENDQ
jgi:hypothetical protein